MPGAWRRVSASARAASRLPNLVPILRDRNGCDELEERERSIIRARSDISYAFEWHTCSTPFRVELHVNKVDSPIAEMAGKPLTRRNLIKCASVAAFAGMIGNRSFAQMGNGKPAAVTSNPAHTAAFPNKFLWGCATAGHQVEGNNTSSDLWTLEHLPESMFKEPSGDACDHYHLYPQDIALLADLGFNTYRFSLEWSRIEPEEGFFSHAQLEHYRRMLATCREHNLTTLLTYSHFSIPRWFAYRRGWQNPAAADLYARFCDKATKHLGDLVSYASTFNEPDIPQLLSWLVPSEHPEQSINDKLQENFGKVRKQLNAPDFADFFLGDGKRIRDGLMAAHHKGRDAMKSVRSDMPVGFNLAMLDDQAAPTDSHLAEKRADVYGPWLEVAKRCDYLGVQTYSRAIVGKKDLPPAKGVEVTQVGWEFYPECVEHVVRYASKETGVPIIVTENGIATTDDSRRVEYLLRALTGLKRAIDDGVDVRGYVVWSLLDNFEWMSGFEPKFGLVAVDLVNQRRTIKPSAAVLGNIARRNSL
jgi:beta-glucosidase